MIDEYMKYLASTLHVRYAWDERVKSYSPCYVDWSKKIAYRWRGIFIDYSKVPRTGMHSGPGPIDSGVELVDVDPPLAYVSTGGGKYALGYLDAKFGRRFYKWRGVVVEKSKLLDLAAGLRETDGKLGLGYLDRASEKAICERILSQKDELLDPPDSLPPQERFSGLESVNAWFRVIEYDPPVSYMAVKEGGALAGYFNEFSGVFFVWKGVVLEEEKTGGESRVSIHSDKVHRAVEIDVPQHLRERFGVVGCP